MKTTRLLFAFTLFSGVGLAVAQNGPADLPPPPGMNDPGAAATPAATAANAPNVAPVNDGPLQPLDKPDTRLVRDKASRDASANSQRIAASQVTKRKQGDDTVEEYRQNGHIWMVKITPQNGPAQTFMDPDGGGSLMRDPNQGPVSPVYYTLYSWK